VPQVLVDAFLAATGHLGDRLMAALQAKWPALGRLPRHLRPDRAAAAAPQLRRALSGGGVPAGIRRDV